MLRHYQNQNLSLYTDHQYAGFPVLTGQGPLIEQYLLRIHQVTTCALAHHTRTFAFRLDLRYPADYVDEDMETNQIVDRFMASFKSKLIHNRNKARELSSRAHDSDVRYVWSREYRELGSFAPHFHMVIFLNNDAFCHLGRFQLGFSNLYNRIHEAWASALRMAASETQGLVEYPSGARWLLQSKDTPVMEDFFYHVSSLAKSATKRYQCGTHAFGSSRL
jgi:hypothetical protein